jgi:hypothetical protein
MGVLATVGLSAPLAGPAAAARNDECPGKTAQRFRKTSVAVRQNKKMTTYLTVDGGGLRIFRVGITARAVICLYHAYLKPYVRVDTSTLQDDEAIGAVAAWIDNRGRRHVTQRSGHLFAKRDHDRIEMWPQFYDERNTSVLDLGPNEHLTGFELSVFVAKKNGAGDWPSITLPRTIRCDLGPPSNTGSCDDDRGPQGKGGGDDDGGGGGGGGGTTPDTEITAGPPASTTNDFAKVYFKAAGAADGFQCQYDGDNWVDCTNPKGYGGVALGTHVVKVRAVNGKLADPSPAAHTWTRVAPNTTITAGPSGDTTRHHAEIFFSSNEATDNSFQCNLNGGGWNPCGNPQAYSGLALGRQTFQVRAVVLGAVDPTPETASWNIIRPDTEIAAGPANGTTSSTATIYFRSPNDPEARFQCKSYEPDATWIDCTNPKSYSSVPKRTNTFQVRAVDLGAEDQSPATWTWTRK